MTKRPAILLPACSLWGISLCLAACSRSPEPPQNGSAASAAPAPIAQPSGRAEDTAQATADDPQAQATAAPSAEPSQAPARQHQFEITAAEAKRRGLTPRRIALDLGEHGLSASPLDEPGRYFHLSGPPGGPLGLELREQPTRTDQALIAAIRAEHQIDAKDISAVGTTEIQGRSWRAVAFVTGQGFGRSIHWVADRDGLTLHAFIDWRDKPLPPDAIARLTKTRPFDHLLGTLEIE